MKFKNLIKTYFISASVLVHCLIIVLVVCFLSEQITSHWRWPIIKRWVMGDISKSEVYTLKSNSFESIPKRQWVKIHQQGPEDSVRFVRQSHAGSGFDQLRSKLLLFGSNTHGKDWNNTVYSFDLDTLKWAEAYPVDLPETYTVNTEGFPVAGIKQNHPWAMHTFGAMAYDKLHDKLVVASYPGHLSPNKYGQSLATKWKLIKKHPTWVYDSIANYWEAYAGISEQFFPYAIAYDSDRGIVTGFRPNGIFEWNGVVRGWEKVGDEVYSEWHTNVAYDSVNHVFILYGGNKLENSIHVYGTGDKTTKKMPTVGMRPPAGQSVPLTFHKNIGKLVALIDSEDYAQTWLYDYAQDQWQQVIGGDFPYLLGMNYNMEYDARNNLLILVSSPKNDEAAVSVWVLKM